MKRHASPQSFVKISQTDLIELEQKIARQGTNLTQLAEENKGLILMQDCHIRQIQELKQALQTKEDTIKEIRLTQKHQDVVATELIGAQDQARKAEGERDVKINELAQCKRNHELGTEALRKQIRELTEEIENM